MELSDPDNSYKTKLRRYWQDQGATCMPGDSETCTGASGMAASLETKAGIVAVLDELLQVVEGEQSISN